MSIKEGNWIERYFKTKEKGTTIKQEAIAGLTTFLAMSYILFVNPNILADAGIPKEAAIASTIWIAALGSMAMGIVANYPVALAPGMGLNAFFAYYVCGVLNLHWTVALGAVFFSGVFFLILTIGGIRQAIINAVPQSLKTAIAVGIGLFIAFIGLKGAGLIVSDPATYVSLGHVTEPSTLLATLGLIFTAALIARKVQGAIILGIIGITIAGMALGIAAKPTGIADIFSFSVPVMTETFAKLDLAGAWHYGLITIIFTLTVVELFDNMGTLIGLTGKAKMVKPSGEIENINRALTTDAVGTMVSAIFGTSTVTSYVESAAGIAAGGRTGITAVATGLLFLCALFFAPVIGLVPGFATAPALVLVGVMMMSEVGKINFNDFTEGFPAFLTIIMMPLTSSIANGFAFGFIGDSFKGSISAKEFCETAKRAIEEIVPDWQVDVLPMADGGEGTVEAVIYNLNGEIRQCEVHDPLGRQCIAKYGVFQNGKIAIMEMAEAAGLNLISPEMRNPELTTSFGVGELILDAVRNGCERIIMGIGGSATNDGGMGMLSALGYRFFDKEGNLLTGCGKNLAQVMRIEEQDVDPRLKSVAFQIACDVENPLTGKHGATYVYAAQKGADPDSLERLENGMVNYAQVVNRFTGKEQTRVAGAGAAGGLGFALLSFLNGQLQSGFELISQVVKVEERICKEKYDFIITGEGQINRQTLFGKLPSGIANLGKKYDTPVIAIVGSVGEGFEEIYDRGLCAVFSIINRPVTLEEAMSMGKVFLFRTIQNIIRLLKAKI